MKIESIKKEGKNKYCLQLEDGTKLKVYDNVILNNQILFKKEINPDLLQKVEIENEKEDVYYQTIGFISRKMRSRQEVIDFLKKKDISLVEEEKILKKLENNHFINDEWYARAYIQDHFHLTNDGPNKIKDYLLSIHINEEVINRYLLEIDKEEIYQKLEKLVKKKIQTNRTKSTYLLKQKILFDLQQLGYEKEIIDDILEKNICNNFSIVTREYQKLYRKLSLKYDGDELKKQIYYKLKQKGFSEEEIENVQC